MPARPLTADLVREQPASPTTARSSAAPAPAPEDIGQAWRSQYAGIVPCARELVLTSTQA
jgi:hypothetical protein